MPDSGPSKQESFIVRWQRSSASERANSQSFLNELCDFLELTRPHISQADQAANTYLFEKAVHYKELDGSITTNFIDLYKKGCFVLEAKQGSNRLQETMFEMRPPEPERRIRRGAAVRGTRGWDTAMLRAPRSGRAVRAIKDALRAAPMQSAQQIASGFKPASRTRVAEILDTLTALGQTRQVEDRYLL